MAVLPGILAVFLLSHSQAILQTILLLDQQSNVLSHSLMLERAVLPAIPAAHLPNHFLSHLQATPPPHSSEDGWVLGEGHRVA